MSHGFGLIIESVVSVLLMLTISYCMLLNSRLKRLKADEQSLKATISELITATEIAERAIAGLKLTVRDCDKNLGERLRTAERFSADIALQISAGEKVVQRLSRIAVAARVEPEAPVQAPAPVAAPVSETQSMVAAAQAFAERARTRTRVAGMAA
jgi:chromosome segregation ATPase